VREVREEVRMQRPERVEYVKENKVENVPHRNMNTNYEGSSSSGCACCSAGLIACLACLCCLLVVLAFLIGLGVIGGPIAATNNNPGPVVATPGVAVAGAPAAVPVAGAPVATVPTGTAPVGTVPVAGTVAAGTVAAGTAAAGTVAAGTAPVAGTVPTITPTGTFLLTKQPESQPLQPPQ